MISSTVIGCRPGDARRIGAILLSQYATNGSGRRRPRDEPFRAGIGDRHRAGAVDDVEPTLAAAISRGLIKTQRGCLLMTGCSTH